ncbi:MAG: hypothetical protein EXR86_09565 [Gammaproteobacteria bacterium]|nr:hypothetical protein [Gammaproteobacteria bacterium]
MTELAALTAAEVLARYPAHADTLPSLVASRVAIVPNAPALRFGPREYVYAELARGSALIAGLLQKHGIEAGVPVAFVATNSDLTVLSFLACAQLGAMFVPMNVALTDPELSFVLGHSKPQVIFARERDLTRLGGLVTALGIHATLLALEPMGVDSSAATEVLVQLSAMSEEAGTAAIAADSPLVVVYTSGTTGFPKGVVHSHRNFVWAAEAFVERMQLQPDERLLTVLPFFHINALFYSLGGALAAGGKLITADSFSASRFWDDATAVGATLFNTIAAVGGILCKRPRAEYNPNHRIRKVYGGPISPDVDAVFRADFGIQNLIEGYGMSEIPGACNNPYFGPHKLGSMGKPARHPRIAGTFAEMRVEDDAGNVVPTGVVGELVVKTPILFKGYLHDPEQTANSFRNGWFLTGDLVREDEDGYFYFIARKKDIIRVRGENVAGAELDRVLGNHPAIAEAATIGVPSALGEEDIFAVLVARNLPPSISDLTAWCTQHLAAIKCPRYWRFVDELPHTPSYRVAKHRLKSDPNLFAGAYDAKNSER